MITPIHIIFDMILYLILIKTSLFNFNIIDILLLLSVNLMDLDHLFSKPIYHPKRNPFKTHFLHKNYIIILIVSFILILIRPITFLGIGLLSHLFLDYIYILKNKI